MLEAAKRCAHDGNNERQLYGSLDPCPERKRSFAKAFHAAQRFLLRMPAALTEYYCPSLLKLTTGAFAIGSATAFVRVRTLLT